MHISAFVPTGIVLFYQSDLQIKIDAAGPVILFHAFFPLSQPVPTLPKMQLDCRQLAWRVLITIIKVTLFI